jgi:hypothetical protein
MKTRITLLIFLLSAIAITDSITVQAQTSPLVRLRFEDNLDASGSADLTFEINDPGEIGFSLLYSSTDYAEGSYALDFTSIDETTDDYGFIYDDTELDLRSTTNLGITGNSARTISAWIRYDDKLTTTNGSHCIVNIGDPSSATQGRNTFTLAAANNKLTVAIGGGNVNYDYSGTDIEDGNWHLVAFTLSEGGDMSDITFYVDGVAVVSDGGSNSEAIATTDDLVYVASRGDYSQKWFDGGGIDDLRIYDYELTAAQIDTLYSNVVSDVTGISMTFEEDEFTAYPTVVEDFLYIESASSSSLDINVFDFNGKVVINTSDQTVDMSGLVSGLYIVNVSGDNKVATFKIIKK